MSTELQKAGLDGQQSHSVLEQLRAIASSGGDPCQVMQLHRQREAVRAGIPVAQCADTRSALQVWRRVSKEILDPRQPFAMHQMLFRHVYAHWNASMQVGLPCLHPAQCCLACCTLSQL